MIEPADVRDLDQEGVMGEIKLSWSSSVQDAFFNARRDILIQGLVARVERLEEVLEDLLKRRKKQQEVPDGND
jgi:hypothetical protein